MLDIKFIRENADLVKKAVVEKKLGVDIDELLKLDKILVEKTQKLESLRAKRNVINGQIKKPADSEERNKLIEENTKLKPEVKLLEDELVDIEKDFDNLMSQVPTVPSKDVPFGNSEKDNVEIERFGVMSLDKFDFEPKDYMTLAKDLDLIDFDRGAKVSGYRGYYIKNELVLIQMGLMMHALTKLIAKGFMPMIPPTIIKEFALYGSGYFSGREYNSDTDEIYRLASRDKDEDGTIQKEDKFLIGTAEPALLAYYSGEVLDIKALPMKLCGFSQCYRSEIGSYGRDTKGIYRVHEFMKVEQVAITPANIELSNQIHEEFIQISKELHQDIGIPYRQIIICTGDLGAGKYKQYDMETWVPSLVDSERGGFAETGSASNFLDWQSRRLNVKYKDENGDKKYVYMLNNTAIPSPRFLISILENYQQKDGSVVVPDVLRKYTGCDVILKKS